jgi:hypothetical protein
MKKFKVHFRDEANNDHITCVYASNIYQARFVAYDTHPAINRYPYSITQIEEVQ